MSEAKQVIITGISSELGQVLATELSKELDVKVIGTMRRKRTKKDSFPPNVQVLDDCDLTNPSCCEVAAKVVDREFSGPFGFVHSVGDFWNHVSFLDFGPKQATRMFESHVTTLYNVLQSLVPIMLTKGGSSCVAFSCNSVRYNYPWMASFTASKSAVDSLIRSLANEFSGQNLRFNSLVLASVKTQKVHDSKPHGDFDHYISPRDIIPIVRFLLSPESRLINGSTINLFEHSEQFYRQGYFERISR